eukprot:Em0014g530a
MQSVWPLLSGKKMRKTYNCRQDLHSKFLINTSLDTIGTHPPSFCYRCKRDKHGPNSEWKAHTEVDCKICHPKPPLHKISPTAGRPAHNSPAQIIAAISGIAPPMQTGLSVQDHIFASTNNPDILDQLRCPLCLTIVHQSLELPCRALVCTNCIVHWFMASNCSEVKCPCCILDPPLAPSQLKPAPPLIQTLLVDIVVQCQQTCWKEIRAGEYSTHKCAEKPGPSDADVQTACHVLRTLASTSSQTITIPTGGTVAYNIHPLTFMRITHARTPTGTASARTMKRRCKEMQMVRDVVSQGESSAYLCKELHYLALAERQTLLQEAGLVSTVGAGEALAIKAGLGLPWAKLRMLRRWLKASGVSIACEENMRTVASGMIGDNLHGEMVLFSFNLASDGEELRAAPLVYMPDLNQQILKMLEENHRKYTVKVFLCGDCEFQSRVYGLSGATGKHPCVSCEIALEEIATTSYEKKMLFS